MILKCHLGRVKPPILSVALSLVVLAGCMPTKQAPDQWSQDKDLVIQSLQDAHVANAKLQENIEDLDQRILSLESISSKQRAKIDALEAGLTQVKTVPVQTRKKKESTKKKKALNKKLDDLSAKLNPELAKKVEVSAEKNAYTAAYLALKSSRYDESSLGFSSVIKLYPEGEYTDQAYYWLGESLVAQQQYKEAVNAFLTVVNKFPDSTKHAASLLKLAQVYKSLNKSRESRAALVQVIKEHPGSRSAELARNQLNSMTQSVGDKR